MYELYKDASLSVTNANSKPVLKLQVPFYSNKDPLNVQPGRTFDHDC